MVFDISKEKLEGIILGVMICLWVLDVAVLAIMIDQLRKQYLWRKALSKLFNKPEPPTLWRIMTDPIVKGFLWVTIGPGQSVNHADATEQQ